MNTSPGPSSSFPPLFEIVNEGNSELRGVNGSVLVLVKPGPADTVESGQLLLWLASPEAQEGDWPLILAQALLSSLLLLPLRVFGEG